MYVLQMLKGEIPVLYLVSLDYSVKYEIKCMSTFLKSNSIFKKQK